MPIDPSISALPPAEPLDIGGAATKGLNLRLLSMKPAEMEQQMAASRQQVSASQTEQANVAAQLGRIRAETAEAERKKRAQDDLTREAPLHVVKNTDGTVQKDANENAISDVPSLTRKMISLGHVNEAMELTKKHAEANAATVKFASDRSIAAKAEGANLEPILRTIPEGPDRANYANIHRKALNLILPGLGDDATAGLTKFTDKELDALRDRGIGAVAAVANRVSLEGSLQAGAAGTGEESRSPTSAQSNDTRKRLAAAGMEVEPGQSHAQMMDNPNNKAVLEANTVSRPAKETAVKDRTRIAAWETAAQQGIDAAADLRGDIKYKISPSDTLGNYLSKYKTDPRWAMLDNALREYETDFGIKEPLGGADRKYLPIYAAEKILKDWKNGRGGLIDRYADAEDIIKNPTIRSKTPTSGSTSSSTSSSRGPETKISKAEQDKMDKDRGFAYKAELEKAQADVLAAKTPEEKARAQDYLRELSLEMKKAKIPVEVNAPIGIRGPRAEDKKVKIISATGKTVEVLESEVPDLLAKVGKDGKPQWRRVK